MLSEDSIVIHRSTNQQYTKQPKLTVVGSLIPRPRPIFPSAWRRGYTMSLDNVIVFTHITVSRMHQILDHIRAVCIDTQVLNNEFHSQFGCEWQDMAAAAQV